MKDYEDLGAVKETHESIENSIYLAKSKSGKALIPPIKDDRSQV